MAAVHTKGCISGVVDSMFKFVPIKCYGLCLVLVL